MSLAIAIAAAYIVGSIDFAVVIGRMHGIDIHQEGSGNPGASNVLRTLGRLPAAMVFVGDTLKGTVGAAMGMVASGTSDPMVHWALLGGLAAVVGHCYPVFHRFKGGKGVATGSGVLLFVMPLVAIASTILWGIIVKLTRTASIGSLILTVATVPLAIWQGVEGLGLLWLALMILLVLWRHRGNIGRMIRGSEQKVPA
ncbi:MAG TPA: glycerol-3-phosphate 1-O-acyltransferase PlsY [Acidimicrobiia bacterium]|nr:glycerol-3-phosphate 1-O-acyltransferase PlsY [Acidimicrobiia bacterium]